MIRFPIHPPIRSGLIASVCLAFACAACTVGPDYHRPETPTPPAFADTGDKASNPLGQTLSAPQDEAQIAAWWTG